MSLFVVLLMLPSPGFSQTISISCGQTITDSISTSIEVDTYNLQGVSQSDTITLQISTISGTLQPVLMLFGVDGTFIASESDVLTTQLMTAGPYTVLVMATSGTGDYRLSLQRVNNSCDLLDLEDPKVTVTAPSGGEIIEIGSTFAITWTSTDNVGVTSHEIRLSTDGGGSFPTVVATGLVGNVQSFDWSVPSGLATTKGRLRVIAQDAAGHSGQDDSDNNFFVVDTAQLTTTSYTYDQLNRLTRVEYAGGKVITYSYDAAGNRTQVVTTDGHTFRLNVLVNGNGTVTGSPVGINCRTNPASDSSGCTKAYNSGTPVSLTATPDAGWQFGGWSGDPDCADGALVMDADKSCIANFTLTPATLPDLTGSWNSASQTCRKGTCTLKGSMQVVNQGNATAPASRMRVILSDDATLDGSDLVLKESSIKKLKPGRATTSKVKVKLPAGVSAAGKYLFAVLDALSSVAEIDETNNTPMAGPVP